MSDPFVVFKVSWLTNTPGEEDRRDEIVEHFYCVTKFLQDNALMVRPLMSSKDDLTDDFTLSSSDLTEDGLAVMRAAYHKWLTKVDNGMPPQDTTLLEKALKKVRG
jgi:hypothetical protein